MFCVMKGDDQDGSPSLHGGNEMLLEEGLTCVGITLKREKCRKMSVSSEIGHAKEEGEQYRVYRVRRRILHEKRGM